ncbi:2278_t:CDS:2 [Dentiscutata erythropus]|uniref:2278_t:CDS:1 n=1 Tax=Dentiscutata erythropus TaxID=1348616 RepID=A0A9N9H4Q0_9GLOM|nr:2278_t:CDS:2 [Dentiscutata erythropus]
MELMEALKDGDHDSYNNSDELIRECFEKIESYLKSADLKRFEFSQFSDLKPIDNGGNAVVFSANFQSKKYALKNLTNNLFVDDGKFKDIKRIKISNGEREKVIPNTPTNYVNLYKKCWSTNPDQRPTLVGILFELEKLANEKTIEFITNVINGDLEQSPIDLIVPNTPYHLVRKEVDENRIIKYDELTYGHGEMRRKGGRVRLKLLDNFEIQDDDCADYIKRLRLEELKHIEQTFNENYNLNKYNELDTEKQRKLKIDFVNYFNLNKGRNCVAYDFVPGTKKILSDNGYLKINKSNKSDPIICFPEKGGQNTIPWAILDNMNLFKNLDDKNGLLVHECDDVRIHIPIATVQYRGNVAEQFSHDITNALDCPDDNEKKERLKKVFSEWGNFIVTDVTIGGAIMIKKWSEINYMNQSRLLTYIQWGIDYAKGGRSKIFSEMPLDVFPQFEISKNIKTIGDLYGWLKGLYDYQYAEIISYEDFKPSYELLPNDLVERIFQCFSSQPVVKPIVRIIPQMLTQCEQQKLLEWIETKKPRLLYMCDWVHDLSLEYGILLQRSKLGHGDKIGFKYTKDPTITPINNTITILLCQPQTKQVAYSLDNGLKGEDELKFSEIPFINNHTLEYFRDLENKPSKTVYCQIIFNAIKISFKSIIKPSEKLSNAVDDALRSDEPFKNLCELFNNTYGLLIPETITLGKKLTRTYDSCNIPKNTIEKKEEYTYENLTAQAIKTLTDWDEKNKDIDTTFFVDDNKIKRDEIEEWRKLQSNNPNNWKVIFYEDLIPTYKILTKSQQSEIESILSDKYRIVFNGKTLLHQDDQTTITIKFPGPLVDEKCQIYGCLVKKNELEGWEKIPNVMIRFDNINRYSCRAIIHKSSKTSLSKDESRILWFILAKPKGYYCHSLRKIKVTYGKLDIHGDQSFTYLKSKEISKDNVLVTSFVSNTLRETTFYKTNVKLWTSSRVDLRIQKVQEDNSINNFEHLTLQWCIINTNEINPTDSEKQESYPWSVFGTVFEDLKDNKKNQAK